MTADAYENICFRGRIDATLLTAAKAGMTTTLNRFLLLFFFFLEIDSWKCHFLIVQKNNICDLLKIH
jgi:hypothetical protein